MKKNIQSDERKKEGDKKRGRKEKKNKNASPSEFISRTMQ